MTPSIRSRLAKSILRVAVWLADSINYGTTIDFVLDDLEGFGYCWDCDGRNYR